MKKHLSEIILTIIIASFILMLIFPAIGVYAKLVAISAFAYAGYIKVKQSEHDKKLKERNLLYYSVVTLALFYAFFFL